ncbi:MAG: carboxylating nicotinate-nucleotide diphosphorylase [Bacteroidetes Order II. Incertae sedis bacterium]|nr:carboxylating nicotinate-nucleotide diphosphorylase [Bacteroidetes Order II. bacterium]
MLPSYLSVARIDQAIQLALSEDVGTGDIATLATIDPHKQATAQFLAKADGVLAGIWVAERVFEQVDSAINVSWAAREGDWIEKGVWFGTVEGPARSVLVAERLVLNFMQRMSGIATATRRMVDAAKPHPAQILDTRKTVPGLRELDKWAVLIGGGKNHRIGLYDMMMIKDNHITAAGGIRKALDAARAYLRSKALAVEIEIETRTLDEVREVLAAGGADRIMLDNMTQKRPDGSLEVTLLSEAVKLIAGKFKTEASGNVTLETIPQIAATGVDFISSGSLTHSVTAMDISLKIRLD